MMEDVKKLHILTDPGVHFKLVRFCHNTRLAHLSRTPIDNGESGRRAACWCGYSIYI
jgi:hypothetical protein